ncbi:gastrin/cholecystokinin type B receptor-like [Liolophura sinensis]|uniref:gastrin/cholecystokinin type B receptor-like n=1 Tax=Liolophura sinensis TaxID=3198878 RepID=UPI003159134E
MEPADNLYELGYDNHTWSLLQDANPSSMVNLSHPQTTLPTARDTPHPPLYILVITTVVCVFEFVIGIIGNLLVAVVIWKNKDMRNSTNFFLLNLSVADLLVIVVCMPSAVMELHARDYWYLGEFMCFGLLPNSAGVQLKGSLVDSYSFAESKLVPFLEHSVAHASALTILVISYERYFAICQPLKAQYICTVSRTLKLIAAVWLISLSASVPFFTIALFKDSQYMNGTPIKVCRQPLQTPIRRAFILILMVIFFIIPVVVLAALYALISKKLFREAICPEMRMDKRAMATLMGRRQVVVLLLTVVVLFLICSLPWRVLTTWLAFAQNSDVEKLGFEGYLALVYFARVMFYFNSCVNPIIYNMVSTKFRRAFKMVLMCQKRTLQRQDTVTFSTVTSLSRHHSSIHSSFSNSSLRTQEVHDSVNMYYEVPVRVTSGTNSHTTQRRVDSDTDFPVTRTLMAIPDEIETS